MPCVLLRIRTWPVIVPASVLSMLRLARASSPERREKKKGSLKKEHPRCQIKKDLPKRLRAYIFAERKSHSPDVAPSGVRHDIFVAIHNMLQIVSRIPEEARCLTWGCKWHETQGIEKLTTWNYSHWPCFPIQTRSTCSGTIVCQLTQFAQSLDAVHDTFIGILVNLCRDKFGLTNSNDRGHYKHWLSGAKVVRISGNRKRMGRRQTSARNMFDATSSLVFSLKGRTSLVNAVDRTEPVKKSPPRIKANEK